MAEPDIDRDATLAWNEDGRGCSAPWRSLGRVVAPTRVVTVTGAMTAADAVHEASQGTGMLWPGDLPGARRLLAGMRKRWDRKPVKPTGEPSMDFYRHRQSRKNRARVLGSLLVELDARMLADLTGGQAAAVRDAYGELEPPPVVSVSELLGVLSAHEWQRTGVWVAALGARIHPRYGVFPPTRDEYVDLVAAAPLPDGATVFDIGTGTGVLAVVLARRGAARVVATDIAAAAVGCARDNVHRLGLSDRVEVVAADLFPPGRADVVVCNPPWLPGTPGSTLDAAVFDQGGRMLSGFVDGVAARLNPGGQAWLVMSDLAERVGLRESGELERRFAAAGLRVLGRAQTTARHQGARQSEDLLAEARRAERVSLWRLAIGG